MKEYYIGLLSGTSIDSIDAALFSIDTENTAINLIQTLDYKIDQKTKDKLNNIIINTNINLKELGETDKLLGIVFADAVNSLLAKSDIDKNNITAIGFHGQTVFHHPEPPYNFSMQLGDANTLTEKTNIPVVTDFRQRDMVHNGQGAPLAPLFHQQFFTDQHKARAIVNIGGITNITLLANTNDLNKANKSFIASDLGPGNTLLDQWYRQNNEGTKLDYDQDGNYAKLGNLNQIFLDKLLSDSYFTKPWPKSTGREYFNLSWLNRILKDIAEINPQDVQNTLTELTAYLIADSVVNNPQINIQEVYLCGGGAYNKFLISRIVKLINQKVGNEQIIINSTQALGLEPDWVEAATFAWLAYCSWHKQEHNLKYITGSNKTSCHLGCIYY